MSKFFTMEVISFIDRAESINEPEQPLAFFKAFAHVTGPYDLGQGYKGYLFNPNKVGYAVVESTSGAMIGLGWTAEVALCQARQAIKYDPPEKTRARLAMM